MSFTTATSTFVRISVIVYYYSSTNDIRLLLTNFSWSPSSPVISTVFVNFSVYSDTYSISASENTLGSSWIKDPTLENKVFFLAGFASPSEEKFLSISSSCALDHSPIPRMKMLQASLEDSVISSLVRAMSGLLIRPSVMMHMTW